VLNKLDPHRMIPYRLYRQDTQYANGEHVRDLSKLNRDISQVLFLSADPHAYAFQPENALKLRRWSGDFRDTTLLDIMPLLQMVALRGVQDIRDVVRSYDGEEDVATAFKRRMAELQSAQKQKAAAAAAPAKPRSALLGR
jgi:import inner membrane translocase subunit TIM50